MSPLPLSWAITRPRPAVDAVLATGPAQVSATFNEHLQTAFAAMTVVGPDENLWSTGEPRVDGAVISIDVMPLGPAGTYTVKLSGDLRRRSRCVGFVAVPLDYSGHRPPWATGRGGGRQTGRNPGVAVPGRCCRARSGRRLVGVAPTGERALIPLVLLNSVSTARHLADELHHARVSRVGAVTQARW